MPGETGRSQRLDSEEMALCQPLFVMVDLKAGPDRSAAFNRRQDMVCIFASNARKRTAIAAGARRSVSGTITKTTKTA
jgi:hypothetical protein